MICQLCAGLEESCQPEEQRFRGVQVVGMRGVGHTQCHITQWPVCLETVGVCFLFGHLLSCRYHFHPNSCSAPCRKGFHVRFHMVA